MMQAAEIVEATTTEYLDHVLSLIRDYQSQLPPQYCFPNDEGLTFPDNSRRRTEHCYWRLSRTSRRAVSVCVRFRWREPAR